MAARKPRVPGYRPHTSGQARVTLDGKDHYLGPDGSPDAAPPAVARLEFRAFLKTRAPDAPLLHPFLMSRS
jgi:hypothetical protein